MAMNKYGRFSPDTTDPLTGARIADPEVFGNKLPGGGVVSSWPELRKAFQAGKLNEDFFGKGGTKEKPTGENRYKNFPSEVKNYLEGRTDKLDDINYDEPVMEEAFAEHGSKRKITRANLNLKPGSPKWKSSIKKGTIPGTVYTPSEEGVLQQVDIADQNGSWGEYYNIRTKPAKKEDPVPTPEPVIPEPVTPMPTKKAKDMVVLATVPKANEPVSWEAPEPKGYKTKREVVKSREGGQGKKVSPFSTVLVPKKDGGGVRKMPAILVGKEKVETKKAKGWKYNMEERQAKAFYAPKDDLGFGGYSDMGDQAFDDQGRPVDFSKVIKSKRGDIRAAKSEFKKNTALQGSEKREAIGKYNESLRQNRRSTREVRRGDLSYMGDGMWQEGDKSKIEYFTPDREKTGDRGAMYNYKKSAQQTVDKINTLKNAESRNMLNSTLTKGLKSENFIKAAEDNATNRNSTQARMALFPGWGKKIK